jgi:hypothetical protein
VLRLDGLNKRIGHNKTKTIMKISSSFAKTLSIAGFIGVAAAATQAQSVISVNIDNNSTVNPTGGPNSNQAGVVLSPNWNDSYYQNGTPYWNNSVANLMDNSGATTTASYTCSAYWSAYSVLGSHPGQDADGSYNRELLNGYFNVQGAESIAISGISYGTYDIYVYFNADVAGRAGAVGIGATTYSFSTVGPASVNGANGLFLQTTDTASGNPTADYAVFTGLTGSSQTIFENNPSWGGINGFQIVAVPEPSSMALAVVGGFGVLLMNRRFKKS